MRTKTHSGFSFLKTELQVVEKCRYFKEKFETKLTFKVFVSSIFVVCPFYCNTYEIIYVLIYYNKISRKFDNSYSWFPVTLMLRSLNIGETSSTTLKRRGMLQGLLSITSRPASLNFISSLNSKSST